LNGDLKFVTSAARPEISTKGLAIPGPIAFTLPSKEVFNLVTAPRPQILEKAKAHLAC